MSTTNNQSIQQINTAALRGTREAHQPDDFQLNNKRKESGVGNEIKITEMENSFVVRCGDYSAHYLKINPRAYALALAEVAILREKQKRKAS